VGVDFWVALFGFLTAIVGGARWLLAVANRNKIRQQSEKQRLDAQTENLKKENQKLFIDNIQLQLKGFETAIKALQNEIREMRKEQKEAIEKLGAHDSFVENMKKFIITREQTLKTMQSQMIKLGDELTMIKGKKNGTQS
jgi:chromosome segregation ATPase